MLCACSISPFGVFCVFFIKPCVAMTNVFFPLRLSQKASKRYWMLSNKVRNSQMYFSSNSEVFNFEISVCWEFTASK